MGGCYEHLRVQAHGPGYVNGSDDDVEMHFATPTASRSPSKRRDFGPAWLREDGGTPAQVERWGA